MRNNRLTVVYKFTSVDDVEARAKAREVLRAMNIHDLPDGVETEIRLHEIHQTKQPRNIPVETETAPLA